MPARIDTPFGSHKRKRIDIASDGRPSIKKPTEDAVLGRDNVTSHIKSLEQQIITSRRHYNSLTVLIELASWNENASFQQHHAVVALCRVFCRLMAAGHLTKTKNSPENETIIMQWLEERLQDVHNLLLDMLQGSHEQQSTALMLCMQLYKEEATHLKTDEKSVSRKGFFSDILQSLMSDKTSDQTKQEFVKNFVDGYDDIRLYTFKTLSAMLANTACTNVLNNAIVILLALDLSTDSEDKNLKYYVDLPKMREGFCSFRIQRKQAQETWMTLLNHKLSKVQRKRLLGAMTHRIAPWFLKIELLMDFLIESFNLGGSTSLLALSGLFYLIQQKNLDYPHFYKKVYSLLDSRILHSVYRSHFFNLLDTFLASTHLPAALVASFIKRLSRLCLYSPPSGIVTVVPWIYNLLKSHPTCALMIHRDLLVDEREVQDADRIFMDPFLMDECDPMHTKAEDSSIWEIQSLHSHYHPNVATTAKIISEQFTKQSYNLEDFMGHSYRSMLIAGLAKTMREAPIIEHNLPKGFFTEIDPQTREGKSLVVNLWVFDSNSSG